MVRVRYWPHTGLEYEDITSYRGRSLIVALGHVVFRHFQGWEYVTLEIER